MGSVLGRILVDLTRVSSWRKFFCCIQIVFWVDFKWKFRKGVGTILYMNCIGAGNTILSDPCFKSFGIRTNIFFTGPVALIVSGSDRFWKGVWLLRVEFGFARFFKKVKIFFQIKYICTWNRFIFQSKK